MKRKVSPKTKKSLIQQIQKTHFQGVYIGNLFKDMKKRKGDTLKPTIMLELNNGNYLVKTKYMSIVNSKGEMISSSKTPLPDKITYPIEMEDGNIAFIYQDSHLKVWDLGKDKITKVAKMDGVSNLLPCQDKIVYTTKIEIGSWDLQGKHIIYGKLRNRDLMFLF
jgi:hypothetical protein